MFLIKDGWHHGSFFLTKEQFERSNYFVSIASDGTLYYWYGRTGSSATYYLGCWYSGAFSFRKTGDRYTTASDICRQKWNSTSETWESVSTFKDVRMYTHDKLGVNDIILSKNSEFYITDAELPEDSKTKINYNVYKTFPMLKTPELSYFVDRGFRVYLNDFYSHNAEDFSLVEEDYALTTCTLNVHDLISNNTFTDRFNVLGYTEVQKDSENRYYLDINFSDCLTYMNTVTADFIISIVLNLKATTIANEAISFSNSSDWRFETNYQTFCNFRYKYILMTIVSDFDKCI